MASEQDKTLDADAMALVRDYKLKERSVLDLRRGFIEGHNLAVVLHVSMPDGSSEWRYYYTGCPTLGEELLLNQQKRICYAVSDDGINWTKRGAIMVRDPQRDYEDVGVAGPVVHQQEDGTFRMWYSAIGTKWGYYSICYAESQDGIHWRRGKEYGDNLQLTPQGSGWEKQMVEYPAIIRENGQLRLFYCGNGYGQTGIGTALSAE